MTYHDVGGYPGRARFEMCAGRTSTFTDERPRPTHPPVSGSPPFPPSALLPNMVEANFQSLLRIHEDHERNERVESVAFPTESC